MVINALNSGAKTFMADFEGELRHPYCLRDTHGVSRENTALRVDSNAPTWSNLVTGQLNLRDAVQ